MVDIILDGPAHWALQLIVFPLLSRDFGRLIIIALVISVPLAWIAVNWRLETYTYKAVIGVSAYFLAGAVAFILALLTISLQTIKAASENPSFHYVTNSWQHWSASFRLMTKTAKQQGYRPSAAPCY